MKKLLALLVLLLGPAVPALMAQDRLAPLLTAARQQLQELNADSASVLLERVVGQSGATPAQLVRAWILLGASRLWRDNPVGAQDAFKQALRLDPTQRVDSLEFLHENLLREFNAARAEIVPGAVGPARQALTVQYSVAAETTLTGPEERLAVIPILNRPARTRLTVKQAGTTAVLELDSLPLGAQVPLTWLPRRADGRPFEGGYTFTVTAVDSMGEEITTPEWTMELTRQRPEPRPAPRPLSASDLRPETLQVRHRSATSLLVGAGLGVAAAVLPSALGRTEVNKGLASDATAYVVAGSATVAGIIGYLNGRRAVPDTSAVRFNAQRRAQYEADVRAVRDANAQAQRYPPVHLVNRGSTTP